MLQKISGKQSKTYHMQTNIINRFKNVFETHIVQVTNQEVLDVMLEVVLDCNSIWLWQPQKVWHPKYNKLHSQCKLQNFLQKNHPTPLEESSQKSLLAVYTACIPKQQYLPFLFTINLESCQAAAPHECETPLSARNYKNRFKSQEELHNSKESKITTLQKLPCSLLCLRKPQKMAQKLPAHTIPDLPPDGKPDSGSGHRKQNAKLSNRNSTTATARSSWS